MRPDREMQRATGHVAGVAIADEQRVARAERRVLAGRGEAERDSV
jgi:hypothetical protein